MLTVERLVSGYGHKQVLNGVSLDVGKGEVVALIGHNGAGKSTVLKAILKILPVWDGDIRLDGRSLSPLGRHLLVRSGIAYVPQGKRVFGSLTVRENLDIAATILEAKEAGRAVERSLQLFPSLTDKLRQRASTLSGGEMQLLALANAFVPSPRILLLDEPTLGLAPGLVSKVLEIIRKTCSETATAALVVEQRVRDVLRISDRVCVLRRGEVSFFGPSIELATDQNLKNVYL